VPQLATDPAFDQQLRQLRNSHPVFRIADARAATNGGTVRLAFRFTCGQTTFAPTVDITGLRPDEAARTRTPTARRLIRALAIVEAFSYWKAYCSPLIEVAPPAADPDETAWWESFWPKAMGEFFYRNGIDYTAPDFLRITAQVGPAPAGEPPDPAPGTQCSSAPPLVMFSGGKDSLALTYAIRDGATDFFLYNPTAAQRTLAQSLTDGGRIIEAHRQVLPELLALNASGHPNGHTPYSAYLATAALLAGYLRGNALVVAGNSRSDDEPNVGSYLGTPVNHHMGIPGNLRTIRPRHRRPQSRRRHVHQPRTIRPLPGHGRSRRRQAIRMHRHRGRSPLSHPGRRTARRPRARPHFVPA
jgi:UDP-N-acetyl-alpha-D-muramoyl-L-alanyl-L-glutamate epimerase